MNSQSLKLDLNAGLSVALVALPLSIGIALASGAPASSGLIAAMIGGLIGSWMGGAHVTVNGPAAGLIVIVLEAISSLGFKGMLASAVAASLLQMVMGAMKFGKRGTAFPSSVIHGMMAAIGIIIIAKQTHILIGHVPVAKNPIMLLLEIPVSFSNFQPLVFIVGTITLLSLILWNKITHPLIKKFPAPLFGVILGSILAQQLNLGGSSLLNISSRYEEWIFFPDFNVLRTIIGWKTAITLALVGSLETILSASAIDKIDPLRRKSDLDRDLISKGFCNFLSSMVGGIPMIAEIVRSSANISFGAQTWRANFFHGLIIFLAVLMLPDFLNLIPLTSLAAILVLVGWRLGNPKHLKHAFQIGKDNVIGFCVTMVITLAVDLLAGIICGAFAQYAVEVFLGLKIKDSFKPQYKHISTADCHTFTVESALIFSNFLYLKSKIEKTFVEKKNINLDLTRCEYIDHTVMEQIDELKSIIQNQGIKLRVDLSNHHSLGMYHHSSQKKTS